MSSRISILIGIVLNRSAPNRANAVGRRRVSATAEALEGRRMLSAAKAVVAGPVAPRSSPLNGGRMLATSDFKVVKANAVDADAPAGAILPGFQIEVRFPDASLTASQKTIFTTAAARWQQIILGDLPNVSGNFFGTGTETIDDLVIEATAPPIDGVGSILGSAGPTYIRSGSSIPISGEMQFDSADVASLESSGQLDEVILHEMGHVLGLGTIWSLKGLITGAGGSNPRFTGAQATAQYQAIFGVATTTVPVENTGGAGTADGHWREAGGAGVAFGPELMTGYLNGGVANPISRVSIAQWADLGYTSVNANAFDVFVPPNGGNAYPTISSLSDSADPVPAGTPFTLTANSVADANGTISGVNFYRESNGIPGLQVFVGAAGDVAADTLLGNDTSSAGGYTFSVNTTGLAAGAYTYYAQAVDNQNLVSVNVQTTNTIGAAVSATPGVPDLVAAFDTGISSTDNYTNRDNSTAAKNLQFLVTGTVVGATVEVYSSGTLIGTAVAAAASTLVTTNGTVDIADGARSIAAGQTEPGKTQSAFSAALGVTIDTGAPAVAGAPVLAFATVKPRVTFAFTESIYQASSSSGFAVTNPGPVNFTQIYSTNTATLTFPGAPNGILPNGNYTATFTPGSLTDAAGNVATGSTSLAFFVLAGDANRDRKVDFNDFLVLQTNFGSPQLDFTKGDFDYNGVIDFNDFLVLQTNFGVTV